MKKLTKGLVLLLVVLLSLSAFAGCKGKGKKKEVASGQIIIGLNTDPNGDPNPWWTNGAMDYAVNKLTLSSYGYTTVAYTKDLVYKYNDIVVKNHKEKVNDDGSKTWTYTIKDNLVWSNGEKITAKDYVFEQMFWSCDEVATGLEAGNAYIGQYLKGFADFYGGKNDYFEGVHLIDDHTFSITVDAENLPYYFEMALVACSPTYMKGWVPADVDIQDDPEKGCRFTENFTVEHIKDTVDNYRFNPTAFCGPYVVESFDKSSLTYTLKANDKYLGNYEGQTARIETIIIRKVEQETMMDELKTGQVDMLPEVTDGNLIKEGEDMVDGGDFAEAPYARNGYGYISFVCDNGPTQFTEVRQALAYLLNRNEFCKTFTQGYGSVVHAAYGLAMHEYEVNKDALSKLNAYNYSLEDAKAALEKGGWTLNAKGEAYDTGVRYKEVTDEEIGKTENEIVKLADGRKLMKLTINWASSDGNQVSDLIATMLVQNADLAKAGVEVKQTVMTFNEMYTKHYANQNETYYNMYNLATGYTPVYDVKESYKIDGAANDNHINDEKLASLAADMLLVDPTDEKAYMGKWLAFQQRYNELLPTLPLYSNTYADFFNKKVKDYKDVNALWNWEYQILYSKIGE